MSKKTLITEAQRKMFMKLANLSPVGLFDELRKEEEFKEEELKKLFESNMNEELELEDEEEGDMPPMPDVEGGEEEEMSPTPEDDMGMGGEMVNVSPEDAEKIARAVAMHLDSAWEELGMPISTEVEGDGEEGPEMGEEPEIEQVAVTDELEDDPEALEEADDTLEEGDDTLAESVMAEVLRRVAARMKQEEE